MAQSQNRHALVTGAARRIGAAMTADAPLKSFGAVDEVAALARYLASGASAYMTGAELTLDRGLLAGSAVSPGD